jgi:glycogen(starch) synthase
VNILVSSHAFAPSLGGIETVSGLLAEQFSKSGNAVRIVTQTAEGPDQTEFGAPIARRPSVLRLIELIKWCDVFWHNNLSLRTVWPALLLGKPVVITHAGSYCRQPNGFDFSLRIKHAVVNRLKSVAVSKYVASFFKTASVIIPNPYDARIFQTVVSAVERKHELVFVGRVVTEKGIDLLLNALAALKKHEVCPRLTVVGSGPELSNMRELSRKFELQTQVDFVGAKTTAEIAQILNEHQIVVIPSRYDEPFGVVALEGIGCGCVAIGSNGGGLPEAIGPCGITFPNGDVDALAQGLTRLLGDALERERLLTAAPTHLAQFEPRLIAERYLEEFRKVAP